MMKKKKGSILIYVMMIFAVLMIMGATLSMLTMQNIKNRRHYAKSRLNVYYSESGLDEAYGIVKEYVENATSYSLDITDGMIETTIADDMKELEQIEEERLRGVDEALLDDSRLKLYKKNGELDEVKLDAEQNRLFRMYYIDYFKKVHNANPNYKNLVADLNSDRYLGVDASKVSVEVLNKTEDFGDTLSASDYFTLNIESVFEKDGIEKKIKTDLEVSIPKYNSKLSFPVKYTRVSLTPVMNKGLVINGKMKLQGKVNIVGDVYVKGMDDQAVVMESAESALQIAKGSLTACEGIVYSYDYKYDTSLARSQQGAVIDIKDRNLYAENILFVREKDASNVLKDGSQGGRLLISGDAYVKDDLQIDSEYVYVDTGKYYGVSDGSSSVGNKVDNSSSIIVNSLNVGENETKLKMGSAVIAGTSYIRNLKNPSVTETYSYQTGESISVKGNYIAYNEELLNSYEIQTNRFGKKDIKYELRKSLLSPLSLVTHYDPYTRWFSLYGETGNREILGELKNVYKGKFPDAVFFRVKNQSRIIPLGTKEGISEAEYTSFINSKTLEVELLKGDSITVVGRIEITRIDEDIESFLYSDKNSQYILAMLTPKGEREVSILGAMNYGSSEALNSRDRKGYGELMEINGGKSVGDDINISIYDRFGISVWSDRVELQDYDEFFMNVDAKDKSAIFKHFYDDYMTQGKIRGTEGVEITDIDSGKSIYTGAVISKNTDKTKSVRDQNFYSTTDASKIIGQRLDVLKDKVFFMDFYEKQYDNDPINPYQDKDIEDFTYSEYFHIPHSQGKTPRNTLSYQLTPSDFMDVNRSDTSNISKLTSTGLYINYGDDGVLLSNKNDTNFNGMAFAGDILKIRNTAYGVIIIKNNLYIKGDFEFSGTIVVMGDVYVENGAAVKIEYDQQIVSKVVAAESAVLKTVFLENQVYKGDRIPVIFYEEISKDNTSIPLRIEKWVVVK